MPRSVEELKRLLGEWCDVRSAAAVLHWDQEVWMPPGGTAARGRQLATLASIAHRQITDPGLESLIRDLHARRDALESDDRALVDIAYYDWERQRKLPESFIETITFVRTDAYEAWVKARAEGDFALFQPHLEKIVDLLQKKADYLGYSESPYDALLEDFERGMTARTLDKLFTDLAQRQSPLVNRALEPSRSAQIPEGLVWPEEAQRRLSMEALKRFGFPAEQGRLDLSVHPFSTSFDVTDVRITTRYDPANPFSGLFGTIHEMGHAFYELDFRPDDARSPLAQAPSLGMHESQSLFWENVIGGSVQFWRFLGPLFREIFPDQAGSLSDEELHGAACRVQRSFIRVDADECTYNLHIVLRFEIERALVEGRLKAAEVRDYWNHRFEELLGLQVPSDSLGCLQDIHWSHAEMGYFPSYALGGLYAAQFLTVLEQDLPDLWRQVEAGDFTDVLGWLRTRIHQVGRRRLASELMESLVGRPLEADPFLTYLEARYIGGAGAPS